VILALDTATPATVVGVASPDGAVLAQRRHDPAPGERPGHTAQLLRLAQQALQEAGGAWGDVTRIGAGVGPGTFTGIRIGVATARALAQGLDAETVAIPTLDALAVGAAAAAPAAERSNVLAILDARRGEAFVAAWSAEGERLLAPAAWPPEELARVPGLAPGAWTAAGDGAVRFRAELEAVGVAVAPDDADLHRVSAGALCRLAAEASPVARDALVPEYVRAPDAEPRRYPTVPPAP
jgi:tRNA threonylcarbamoyladenosine biosynthesis protein TsaB